jgi:PiT family inorganic phosphate transporter
MILMVVLLLVGLAAANGSNDVPKGVATLAGAGVTRFRTAILWGTVTTLVGCLVSLQLADKMTKLFSKGIVSAAPTDALAVAVLVGTASWVGLATFRRLPVSTTHALVGSLVGAGVLLSATSVQWHALLTRVVQPLLLSVFVSFGISLLLAVVFARRRRGRPRRQPAMASMGAADAAAHVPLAEPDRFDGEPFDGESLDGDCRDGDCRDGGSGDAPGNPAGERLLTIAHWFTSGLTGFARGLNDTPKIVAVGAFALVPAGWQSWQILLVVAAAMAVGSVVGGMRVAQRLGCDVVRMSHREGFLANLTTATLVGAGAGAGLPMSTTHVSTGAIAGSAGTDLSRIKTRTIRDFVIAWLVTPLFAAAVAAVVFLLLQ